MTSSKISASIVGASGYGGGEALRLLLGHPDVEVRQVTSERHVGSFVHHVHPNLRGVCKLKFTARSELKPCDVLFLAMPHGESQANIEQYRALAPKVIDLASDFRLRDPAAYEEWYGHPHQKPALLSECVYGLVELHREELRGATFVAGCGCLATAMTMALWPFFKAGVVRGPVVAEGKIGSSAAGNHASESSHHPERAGAVRSFKPTHHRHTGEVRQELAAANGGRVPEIYLSGTAIEMVRGILVTAHVFTAEPLGDADVWKILRAAWGKEPFVRLVKDQKGVYRYPEPKIVAGTNFCDIGFEVEEGTRRVVVMAAIDNLVKGTSGNAVQAMNLMFGLDETTALGFAGLHP
ncbi:MAG TPA: N-acetyl-gamma-glutamyl-phosphate reductase [Myxococcota bacterium]|nr:N-acetyl-gamma-glutamyl-phosphate reductase [Myxococcota bacterium]